MSFYGNLSDRSRTDLKFDKIYPNRFTMDSNATTDSVYVGRYVLINYEDGYNDILPNNYFESFYCIERQTGRYDFWSEFELGIVGGEGYCFKPEAAIELSRPDDNDNLEGFEKSIAFKTGDKKHIFNFNTEDKYVKFKINDDNSLSFLGWASKEDYDNHWKDNKLEENKRPIIKLVHSESGEINVNVYLIPEQEENDEEVDLFNKNEENISILKLFKYHEYSIAKEPAIFVWPYNKDNSSNSVICVGTIPEIENKDGDYFNSKNGKLNFRIDEAVYNTSARGYHSTVWEKVYINDKYKYIKIAELNTYVPTINLKANAPTDSPKAPHFAPYGDNINYELDWQPPWGFRIKSADANLKLRKFDENGIKEGSSVLASKNYINSDWVFPDGSLKSDVNTKWTTQLFDEETRTYKKYQLEKNGNNPREWRELSASSKEEDALTPAAIYFNKAGFDKYKSTYSSGTQMAPSKEAVKNYISIEPSGYSGRIYSDNVELDSAPDTQELSVMLPVLGDTVAEMWDLIYGNGDRNTNIEWQDASYLNSIRAGLRMHGEKIGYDRDAMSTLAGCINTAHDLIGMIVAESKEDLSSEITDIDKYSEYFIYYNPTDKKYYQKQPYTFLQPLENYDASNLENNEIFHQVNSRIQESEEGGSQNKVIIYNNAEKDKYYFKENPQYATNGELYYDYILANTLQPDKQYVEFEEGAITPLIGLTEFETNNNYFTESVNDYKAEKGQTFDPQKTYFTIDWEPFENIDPETGYKNAIYFPNEFYYEVPVYGKKKNPEDGTTFIGIIGYDYFQDTSLNGFQYPVKEKDFITLFNCSCSEADLISAHYLDDYVNRVFDEDGNEDIKARTPKPTRYFLPKKTDNSKIQYVVEEGYVPVILEKGSQDNHLYGKLFKKQGNEYQEFEDNDYLTFIGTAYTIGEHIIDKLVVEIETDEVYRAHPYDLKKYYFTVTGNDTFYNMMDSEEAKSFSVQQKINNFSRDQIQAYVRKSEPKQVTNLYSSETFPICYTQLGPTNEYIHSYVTNNTSIVSDKGQYFFIDTSKVHDVGIFEQDDYYIQKEDGTFEQIKDFTQLENITANMPIYRKEKDIRVYKDDNDPKEFKTGAIWDALVNPPEGIQLGIAVNGYKMFPLEGFARNMNTMLGLIVKINALINDNNPYTRNRKTLQGTLNYMNDIINKIDELYPNELVFTDQFGRIYAPNNSVDGDKNISVEIKNQQLSIKHLDPSLPEMTKQESDDVDPVPMTEEEIKQLISSSLQPIYLQPFEEVEDEEEAKNIYYDKDGNKIFGRELTYIKFEVPVLYVDSKGHIYKQTSQEYRIENSALASAALNSLEHRVAALERNALRVYKEGIVYKETEDVNEPENIAFNEEGEIE